MTSLGTRASTSGVTAGGVQPCVLRRLVDILFASVGLLVFALPLLALCVVIRATSPGPAIYRQRRVGQGGRPFTIYKLRSMRVASGGPEVTAAGDPRVTAVGRLLRRTSLDELPQLWNVLRGQMTLVGARPDTPALAALYPPHCQWVLEHRPGLTGPAQVRLRDAAVITDGMGPREYAERVVVARVALDATFLSAPTLRAELAVLLDTARHLAGRPVGIPSQRTGD